MALSPTPSRRAVLLALATGASFHLASTALAAAESRVSPYDSPTAAPHPISDIDPGTRPPPVTDRVYLDISIDNLPPRRVLIDLYGTITPRAVANFKALAADGYAGTSVYRVVPGLTVQLGDVLRNGGKSGRAAGGGSIAPDNFRVAHSVPGLVSMAKGADGMDSRFFVNTRPGDSSYLDGRYCAFGRVAEGMDVLYDVERRTGSGVFVRLPKVKIVASGVLGEGERDGVGAERVEGPVGRKMMGSKLS